MQDETSTETIAAGQLKSIIDRVETLQDEESSIRDDKKEIYAEAKANGFDVKALKAIIALRKKTSEERQEEEAMLDLYMSALGMTS
jgi:uncharacterized protein (UPF0335 family)